MKKFGKLFLTNCQKLGAVMQSPTKTQAQMMLFVFGLTLICLGTYSQATAQYYDSNDVNTERLGMAFDKVLLYLEGSFGALVMVAAGLGAILSSAFGQYKAALGCLIIAVGTFILRSFITTFFNVDNSDVLLE